MTESERDSVAIGQSSAVIWIPRLCRLGAVTLFALLAALVVIDSFGPSNFNHDVAWFLYGSERILDGARLYIDLVDENPPLIYWLAVPPVALARWTGLPTLMAYNLCVLTLILLSCTVCQRILRMGWVEASSWRTALIAMLASAMVLVPGYDFGQRDHLMLVAVIPYLIAAAARAARRPGSLRLGIVAGLLAGLGMALKPYFLVVWLAVETWLFLASGRDHWRRTENFAIAGVNAVFLLAVVVFAAHYIDMVHIALEVLDAYAASSLLTSVEPAVILRVAIAAGLVAFVRASPLDRELRQSLMVGATGFLASALLQGKGWSYHFYPADAAALTLMGVVFLGLVDPANPLRTARWPRAGGIALALILLLNLWGGASVAISAARTAGRLGEPRPDLARLTRVVEDYAEAGPIWVMSTSVYPAFPLVNVTGSEWSSRFSCLWLLPGLYTPAERAMRPFPYHSREEMRDRERYLVDSVVEDLRARPPALLMVDLSGIKQGFGDDTFEFLSYFRRDPHFDAFFSQYRQLLDVAPFRVYKHDGEAR